MGSEASDRRTDADESVSVRFTRLMKATTSRWGVITDPPIVAVGTAVGIMALLAARHMDARPWMVELAVALTLSPTLAAVVVTLALSGARARVVDWLAAVPFPVENMNAVLNGLGEALVVEFAGEVPATPDLNAQLDAVHTDCFVTEAVAAERRVELRIGVADSKRNPAASNHRRYERVRAIVDRVLVPLSTQHPIREVRVK